MQFNENPQLALAVCFVCLALTLTGCQTPPREAAEPTDTATTTDAPGALSAADQAEVARLLEQAEQAMQADHLTYPAKGSALTLFDAARAIDPDNIEAQRGLERIVEHYIDIAESAASRGQLARARSMLDRARIVDSQHPAIAPTERRLALLESSDRERLRINAEQLRSRSPTLVAALQEIAVRARDERCRAIIRVGNDADGRWIYQRMNAGSGDRRIRAQVQIGTPPQVEVLCFPG